MATSKPRGSNMYLEPRRPGLLLSLCGLAAVGGGLTLLFFSVQLSDRGWQSVRWPLLISAIFLVLGGWVIWWAIQTAHLEVDEDRRTGIALLTMAAIAGFVWVILFFVGPPLQYNRCVGVSYVEDCPDAPYFLWRATFGALALILMLIGGGLGIIGVLRSWWKIFGIAALVIFVIVSCFAGSESMSLPGEYPGR